MDIRRYLTTALAATALAGAQAQLHESLSVEGTYIPDIIMLDRINTFPQRPSLLPLDPHNLAYRLEGVATDFAPQLLTLTATEWMARRNFDTQRGYITAGLGSWLNADLSAGYLAVNTPTAKVGIKLQYNSTSLWRPRLSEATDDVRRRRQDGTIGLYANRTWQDRGTLSAAVDWRVGWFNYYAFNPAGEREAETAITAPTQTLTAVELDLGWQSARKPQTLNWHAGLEAHTFGYRALPLHTPGAYRELKGDRENRFALRGGLDMPWDNGSEAGLDMRLDIVGYAKREAATVAGFEMPGSPETYAQLTLSPWYRFTRGELAVKAGFGFDITCNAQGSQPGSHYSLLHIAPAVALDWRRATTGVYLHLTGGSQLQTLANGAAQDYYQLPAVISTQPLHTPLDARLGAMFGPFSGFSAGVELAYRVDRHRRDAGWYTVVLNQGPGSPVDGLDTGTLLPYLGMTMHEMTLQGFSAGINASWSMTPWIKAGADFRYQPQNGTTGFWNGIDRPRITASVQAETNPWRSLRFGLQYAYRGVRRVWSLYPPEESQPTEGITVVVGAPDQRCASLRLPDISDLNFKASYDPLPALTVWLQASNLLNRRNELLPSLPAEGITVTAGFGWRF